MSEGYLTVSQLRAALAALPPEYDDVEVSLNSEYTATEVEPIDYGRETVMDIDGRPVTFPRYRVEIHGH